MDTPNLSKPKSQPPRKQKPINEYVKYSGLAFQMAALILLGYWLGGKLDKWLEFTIPVFTIILILLFLSVSFYSLIKSLPKD
ncbi:MAG: AtpZ/AtpI family protein [Cyclobacteriaceae bacterium]|nr:AtpZ/AtpI family protein [Cyclobacteriaceae bacterium]